MMERVGRGRIGKTRGHGRGRGGASLAGTGTRGEAGADEDRDKRPGEEKSAADGNKSYELQLLEKLGRETVEPSEVGMSPKTYQLIQDFIEHGLQLSHTARMI